MILIFELIVTRFFYIVLSNTDTMADVSIPCLSSVSDLLYRLGEFELSHHPYTQYCLTVPASRRARARAKDQATASFP